MRPYHRNAIEKQSPSFINHSSIMEIMMNTDASNDVRYCGSHRQDLDYECGPAK